jgi:hypothetical protein
MDHYAIVMQALRVIGVKRLVKQILLQQNCEQDMLLNMQDYPLYGSMGVKIADKNRLEFNR